MTSTFLRALPILRIGVIVVAVAAISLLFVSLPVQADDECGTSGWSQELNPWSDARATDPDNAGIQALYNSWNAANNFGWTYNDATLGDSCESGSLLPYATIIASPMTITEGQSSLLSWASQNVGACTINQGIGSVPSDTTGSRTVTPTINTTYTLTCAGADPASVTVIVEPVPAVAPTATLTADPTAITSGESSTLTWGSTNATSCVGSNFSTGGATSGTVSVSPTANTNYSVTCSNAVGSQTAYAAVSVTAVVVTGPDLTASSVSPSTAVVNTAVTLSSQIANVGSGSTGSTFNNVFQIDSNSDHTSGVTNYAGSASPVTNAGASYASLLSRTFATAGTWYVRACADNNTGMAGTIVESNEANNCSGWTAVTVTAAVVNGSVTCNVDKTTAAIGEQVTYTAVPSGGAGAPYAWTDTPNAGDNIGDGTVVNRTYTSAGTYAMSLTANGASSGGFCPNVTVGTPVCPGPESATISAAPDRVRSGNSTTVTWSAQNVQGTCTISGPGINQTVTAASCAVPSTSVPVTVTAQSVYRITCTGATDSVVVNLLPLVEEF